MISQINFYETRFKAVYKRLKEKLLGMQNLRIIEEEHKGNRSIDFVFQVLDKNKMNEDDEGIDLCLSGQFNKVGNLISMAINITRSYGPIVDEKIFNINDPNIEELFNQELDRLCEVFIEDIKKNYS